MRMFFDYIEKEIASLKAHDRETPQIARALSAIAGDRAARARFIDFARDADEPAVRARMIALARNLGWLSPTEQRAELIDMIAELLARNSVGSAEVDLACTLNRDGELDGELDRLRLPKEKYRSVPEAAVLACLGNQESQRQIQQALASPKDEDVQMAQVYLRHRPLGDTTTLRAMTTAVSHMSGSEAQVRALNTLASYRLSDRQSLEELMRLFSLAKSVSVQRAVAGILVRSDFREVAELDLARELRRYRLKSADGDDIIDVLIRRLPTREVPNQEARRPRDGESVYR